MEDGKSSNTANNNINKCVFTENIQQQQQQQQQPGKWMFRIDVMIPCAQKANNNLDMNISWSL